MQPLAEKGGVLPVEQGLHEKKPIDRIEFLNAIFKEVKPSKDIAMLLGKKPEQLSAAEAKQILDWALDTKFTELEFYIRGLMALNGPFNPVAETTARDLIKAAVYYHEENHTVSEYFFQQSKLLLDKGLAADPRNISLLNALIVYQSEYEEAPMQFLATLRKAQAIDSMNPELNEIHFNLLKKSNQLEKALSKCKKMLSLQPQSENWLFKTSEVYGLMGDSTNSRIFLNLGVKARKRNN